MSIHEEVNHGQQSCARFRTKTRNDSLVLSTHNDGTNDGKLKVLKVLVHVRVLPQIDEQVNHVWIERSITESRRGEM